MRRLLRYAGLVLALCAINLVVALAGASLYPRFQGRWSKTENYRLVAGTDVSWRAVQTGSRVVTQVKVIVTRLEVPVEAIGGSGIAPDELGRMCLPWGSSISPRRLLDEFADRDLVRLEIYERGAGWPFRSLRAADARRLIRGQGIVNEPGRAMIVAEADSAQSPPLPLAERQPLRVLPLGPAWGPFLANILVYALILLGLVRGRSWLLGVVRRWGGRCAACGYPIGTSDTCTECGAAVARRADDDSGAAAGPEAEE